MKKRKLKTVQYTPCGLDYVYLLKVPVDYTEEGDEYIDLPVGDIEKSIARALTVSGVPLHGREIKFLRKALKLPRNEWAKKLGISAAGIFKWENEPDRRLSKVNEVAIRILCAEQLGVELDCRWDILVPSDTQPRKLEVKAA